MPKERLTLTQACRQAADIVSRAREMEHLYHEAVRCMGEGELLTGILNMATEAMQDESLRDEIFVSNESILSFLCGIWIQFLLIEIAGVKKEKLRSLARQAFKDTQKDTCLH